MGHSVKIQRLRYEGLSTRMVTRLWKAAIECYLSDNSEPAGAAEIKSKIEALKNSRRALEVYARKAFTGK